MKKVENQFIKYNTITEVHYSFGLPKPLHPLISLIDNSQNTVAIPPLPFLHVLSFYKIVLWTTKNEGWLRYGQNNYDFNEGGMFFGKPGQILGAQPDSPDHSGYVLLIHPDFFKSFPLVQTIKDHHFFDYSVNEMLHLSDKEKETVINVFKNIEDELNNRLDDYTQEVIIAQIELILTYANRFYKRQFITRKVVNHDILLQVEAILEKYFNSEDIVIKGLPTVAYLADQVHLSPNYLGDLLRSLTGQNAQQIIHEKLIEKAKEKLSSTNLLISEIAYELGFEHPQSFSKIFKAKTHLSPLGFRQSFN
ncbi:helix-turn-helix domain-containing protein [Rhizosphaericola mali]|uniref:AraC family transcriptional regulator n=1 Tax=Rhizosphaericola mali TaxID=2545455 RepID=A0A5P2G5G1_9BACT|nr:response regulator transcription factor [Rhizosphaericola mali]QES88343.1 AraC family transcriptional regulator [Rhizosphaericola mali]